MTDKVGRQRGGRESVAHSSARGERVAKAAIPKRRKGKKGVGSSSETQVEAAHDIGLEPQHVDEVVAEYEAQHVDEVEGEYEAHDDDELDPPYIYNSIDQLEENEDEDEVDYSSKKKRALTSSKRKYVAKNGKAYKKSKKENGDSEKTTKEPPKKFSRSSRRRKRQVDQALLDDYELGSQPMSIKKILAVAHYKERQEKKEAKYSTNQSGGDFFHGAGANNEEETFSSDDDGFREEDDQARKKFTSTAPLYNSHSFKDKPPRVKWSKQDTEKFYEALKEFGLDFPMIQQIFPHNSRRQILLKFKNEDRHHPLQITDAINSRSSDHRLYKLVIAKLPQISTANANQEAIEDTAEDMSPGINEEIATTEQEEDPAVYHSPEQSDESDDNLQKWSQYQSIF